MSYVDGFVMAVKKDRLEDYKTVAAACAVLWKANGARRIVEAVGEEVPEGEITSFSKAVHAAEDEVVIFSWIEYPDKATRDACNRAVENSPELNAMDTTGIMNGKTMIYAGFTPFVDSDA